MVHLENLPYAILRSICVAISDCRAFALVARSCVKPARSVLFAKISITFYDTRELGEGALTWVDRLQLVESFQHVRTLRIVDEDTHPPIEKFHECGDSLREKWQYLPDDHPDRIVDEASAWQALAELLSRLSGLKDFAYAGALQLHPCILQCLEDKLLICRLHLETFCLRSLLCSPQQRIDLDPYEKKLATHRQLYSVKIARFDEYDDGVFDFHLDALSDMVRGMAPSLRKVSLLREKPGSSPQLLRTKAQTRQKWKGSELGSLPLEHQGMLTSLELAGPGSASLEALQHWSEVTTFSALDELRLQEYIDADTVDWLSNSCSLAHVSKLTIHPASCQMAGLFQTICNLTELKLVGNFDNEQIYEVLLRHGTSLQQLAIMPSVVYSTNVANMLEIIARLCPRLTHFCTRIPRTNGNVEEVRLYRAIGQIARLQKLHVVLDCRDPHRLNNSSEEVALNETIKRALINHAIDSSLAQAIFKLIASSNPASPTSLQSLAIHPETDQNSGGLGLACGVLAGQWLCERNVRDDRKDQVNVQRMKRLRGTNAKLTPMVANAFDKLWPDDGRSLHWSERWSSFSLDE